MGRGIMEEVRLMGMSEVVAEAFKILRSAPKLLCAITVTLLLPLHCAIANHSSTSNPRLENIMKESGLLDGNGTYSLEREALNRIYVELGQDLLLEAAHKFSVFAFSLLFTAAAVYAAASIYAGNELSYARVMSAVPRVWKRLLLTFLWYFAALFAYYVAVFHCYVFWCISSIKVTDFNVWRFLFGMLAIFAASLAVHVYIGMVWDVASVACVLEGRWGLAGLQRSQDLIKGKRGMGLALRILLALATVGIEGLVGDGQIGAITMGALVALRCGFDLIGLLIQIVFYFHCKSFHHEAIDRAALSDHLETTYMGKYRPDTYASKERVD